MSKLKIFSPETFSGGTGGLFSPGAYVIKDAKFVKFDFAGKVPGKGGDGLVCLCCKIQGLDKDGNEVGEELTQYYSVGDDFDIVDKGKSIEATGQYETIWKLSDYAIFVEMAGKAGFDRDKFDDENDITVLEGVVADWARIASPREGTRKVKGEDGKVKEYPNEITVMTKVHQAPDKKGTAKGKDKPAATSKANGSAAAAATNGSAQDPEEVVQAFLAKKVLLDKNAGGIDKLQARMNLNSYVQKELGGDADMVQKVAKCFNSKLEDFLTSAGWGLKGQDIVRVEE